MTTPSGVGDRTEGQQDAQEVMSRINDILNAAEVDLSRLVDSLSDELSQALTERDRARDLAVALEAELAACQDQLAACESARSLAVRL